MTHKTYPVMKAKCDTCPFREGGWQHVAPLLVERATSEATPLCHSTGENALVPKIGTAMLCRGARDVQLLFFHRIGFIAEPTEEAWAVKCEELGVENIVEQPSRKEQKC